MKIFATRLTTVAMVSLLAIAISGCGGASQAASAKKLKLYISTISWKDPYGNGGKCETGLEVADFWREGSSISVYDANSGELLGGTQFKSKVDDPESRICDYTASLSVKEVQEYKIVFDKGRLEVNKSLADLRIMASEFPLGDLVFVYELGA